jgi:hypothetical protein
MRARGAPIDIVPDFWQGCGPLPLPLQVLVLYMTYGVLTYHVYSLQ